MRRTVTGLGLVMMSFSVIAEQSKAQIIIPDSTLNTVVNTSNNRDFTITGGITAGTHLFHSFREFSIPTNGAARFANPTNIQTIFSRVTGGTASNIDGLLQTNGSASLFLLNPNGILFGANARLNIGGSFIGTTADRVKFADGSEFSATSTDRPLLTISAPIGLQMGQTPGEIRVRGTGHTQTYPGSPYVPFDRNNSDRGLSVPAGKTLGLIGGNLVLERGILTAEGGHVELGAVTESQIPIRLSQTETGWGFGYDGIAKYGDIRLNQRSLVDASGIGNGSIQLQGRQIDLLNGSTLLIQNIGTQAAGTMRVNASEALTLQGDDLGGLAVSEIRTENLSSGKGADIVINAPQIAIRDGAQVSAWSLGSGTGGALQVNADRSLQIIGFASGNSARNSFLGSANFGTAGSSGNVLVSTSQLSVTNGGVLTSTSAGVSRGGNVTINARESIQVSGITPIVLTPSLISTIAFASGNAGRLTIDSKQITVTNGGNITASTLASGASGDLIIRASEFIRVEGQFVTDITSRPSQIIAASDLSVPSVRLAFGLPPLPTGTAGSLSIQTPQLQVLNGGEISVRNDSVNGNAGTLQIQADSVLLDHQGKLTAPALNGRGGNISLDAQSLHLNNGAQVNASTLSGQAGDIRLAVRGKLQLSNQSEVLSNVQQAGQGGNITIEAADLRLNRASRITTNVQGTATGGTIQVSGDRLVLREGSTLSAVTAGAGNAGNVSVNVKEIDIAGVANTEIRGVGMTPTPSFIGSGTFPGSRGQGGSLTINSDRIRVSDGALISAGTLGQGNAGDAVIRARESITLSGVSPLPAPLFGYRTSHPSRISASSLSNASAGSVNIQTPLLTLSDGAVIEVNSRGQGGAGNLEITSDRVRLNNQASLAAEVAGGRQGNIKINTNLLTLRRGSQITTNATKNAEGGNITINAPILLGLENSDIIANAVQGQGGKINITTQGIFGLQYRDRLTPESDITASSDFGIDGTVQINNIGLDPNSGLIELSAELADAGQKVAEGCSTTQGSSFIITGRGGIPESPINEFTVYSTWADLRPVTPSTSTSMLPPVAQPLREATSWYRNSQTGQIELIVDRPMVLHQPITCGAARD
ncbi:two-partner secretion domain-containing protein [Leptolyngbya sp. NIES-2104]|uniref:two-partner secretion domain-containing protein n=1 Tax=Leptolyngbya sp. NIES-2104 TaxID=1552121 RepID=UPI0006EC665C|nr:filamentous hemagglutinin N-terminal domain-containing protein [Leptolyngbya sp. NIES-2104]GAP95305.1 putative hemagglutinin-related protein [Leptolyngbya sp. NIES-2104]